MPVRIPPQAEKTTNNKRESFCQYCDYFCLSLAAILRNGVTLKLFTKSSHCLAVSHTATDKALYNLFHF